MTFITTILCIGHTLQFASINGTITHKAFPTEERFCYTIMSKTPKGQAVR